MGRFGHRPMTAIGRIYQTRCWTSPSCHTDGACRIHSRTQAKVVGGKEPLTGWLSLGKNDHLRNTRTADE